MKFTASTVAFVLAALAMAHPESIPSQGEGVVHNIDTRALTANDGNIIFGRAINCPSNNPSVCCALPGWRLLDGRGSRDCPTRGTGMTSKEQDERKTMVARKSGK
ncbi:hypothetical protein V8F06_008549 [Rhypophila decipiens]